MPEILKYMLGENKFIYTFNGKVSGEIELELVRRIVTDSKNKVYIISGCHGHSSGENWIKEGKHLVYKENYLDKKFYNSLNYFMPDMRKINKKCQIKMYNVKHLNGKDFEEKLDKKSGHIVLCYCYTDRDVLVKKYLKTVEPTVIGRYQIVNENAIDVEWEHFGGV